MSDDRDAEKARSAGKALWAAGGAKLMGTAAVATGGLLAIPLGVAAVFYGLWAINAADDALKDD